MEFHSITTGFLKALALGAVLASCNVVTEEYSLIYTSESPNKEFAETLEQVLESSFNVDIILDSAQSVSEVVDALSSEEIDMGLVENLHDKGEGIQTVIPVYPKILHLLYHSDYNPTSIETLFYDHVVYVGRKGSASRRFMADLFGYYELDNTRITITENMEEAQVLALFSVIMDDDELRRYKNFKLFSIDGDESTEGSPSHGISLKFPRVRPFVIPEGTYGGLTPQAIYTIATDMVYVVRESMGSIAVSDLTRSLFAHRERFVHLHPSFYQGIIEDFDRSKLSYPLHEGARAYLDRDEPGFFERYAELAGVIFTVFIAFGSGLASFNNRRKQKKKDKVDVFYAHLMKIKNELHEITGATQARAKIQEVKDEQNRAFEMLINEELSANDSFRIYMDLSRETIEDIRIRLRLIKERSQRG